MLEREEEFILAKKWVDNGDSQAAHKMVTSHLRLAAKIAMGYRVHQAFGLGTGLNLNAFHSSVGANLRF